MESIKTKDYFNFETQERKAMHKKLSKYIGAFDYIDKTLIFLSALFGGISIIFIGVPAAIASASFTLIFSLTSNSRNNIETVKNKNKNKKRDITKVLCLLKAN